MNITKETIKSTLRGIMAEESEYQTFFKKALEKAGKSIPSMSDDEKKAFFDKIDAAWNAKGEKNEGNAFGAAVTAAKETGEDEFEVGGKTYKVEESADCGCGCGGCNESINEATDRDFEKVYSIFDKKDYFGLKGSIKTMLGNWQRALDKGDKGAQQYSKEDVIDSVTAQTKARAKHTYDELVKAIKNKDINALKSKLRHDQPFSIAIFTQTTGKKLPKSTRDIHSFLDNEFMSESITEAEQKYTVIDPRGNQIGAGLKIQAASMAKKKGGEKAGYFVVPVKNALKARRALEKFKGDFKNPKLKDIMSDLYFEGVESVNEGRAFINAAKKAKAEGKTEFEFNGKTYPVTIKESVVNEGVKITVPGNILKKVKKNPKDVYQSSEYAADGSIISYFSDTIKNKYYVVYHGKNYEVAKHIDIKGNPNKFDGEGSFKDFVKKYDRTKKLESVVNEDANMNKKVKAFLDKGLKDLSKGKPNHQFAVMHILMGALTDANFHSESKKVPSIFPKAKYEGDPMGKQDAIEIYEEMGENVASICKWDGKDIVDAIGFYVSMTIGRPVGEKVEKLVESVNETIYLLNNKR